MGPTEARVRRCVDTDRIWSLTVHYTIVGSTGRVRSIRPDPELPPEELTCVRGVLNGLQFPRFSDPTQTTWHTYHF